MAKATWKGAILAQSDRYETVEGNIYFPAEALDRRYFRESSTETLCSWKGTASYFTIVVDDQVNEDAAWTYRQPLAAADNIKGYVAFWRGVNVES
jgi:uncharacterized protein (DUF427 family)